MSSLSQDLKAILEKVPVHLEGLIAKYDGIISRAAESLDTIAATPTDQRTSSGVAAVCKAGKLLFESRALQAGSDAYDKAREQNWYVVAS